MIVKSPKALKITIILAVAAVGVFVFYRWRTAGNTEVQAITQRIAIAIQRNDRDALLRDPVLVGREGTVDWLLRFHPDLANGYGVFVLKNGDGVTLFDKESVSHLGKIKSASSNLLLGFKYDRKTNQTDFVVAGGESGTAIAVLNSNAKD